jgi:hypothetical protein
MSLMYRREAHSRLGVRHFWVVNRGSNVECDERSTFQSDIFALGRSVGKSASASSTSMILPIDKLQWFMRSGSFVLGWNANNGDRQHSVPIIHTASTGYLNDVAGHFVAKTLLRFGPVYHAFSGPLADLGAGKVSLNVSLSPTVWNQGSSGPS